MQVQFRTHLSGQVPQKQPVKHVRSTPSTSIPTAVQQVHFNGLREKMLAGVLAGVGILTTMGGAKLLPHPKATAHSNKAGVAAKPHTASHQQVSFPLQGEYTLYQLMRAYDIDLNNTRMPETIMPFGEFLFKHGIDPNAVKLKIDPNESVEARLARWGFNPYGTLKVNTKAKFKRLILATLESYFRINRNGKPNVEPTGFPLSTQDRFIGHLMRLMLAHDVYLESLTGGQKAVQADGSVLFETGLAPENTGNSRLLRTKETLLSQLDAIELDSRDGKLNGAELLPKAAWALDQSTGTHYVDLANKLPYPIAKMDIHELKRTNFGNPFTKAVQDRLTHLIGISYRDFILANHEQHALSIGGWATSQANPPHTLKEFNRQNAEKALSNDPLGPFQFGFVERRFPAEAKTILQEALNEMNQTGNDPFREGGDRYMRKILKDPTLAKTSPSEKQQVAVTQKKIKPEQKK